MGRFKATVLILIVIAACQNQPQAATTPLPKPTPTPHSNVTSAILQSTDVPATLTVCSGSGPIDVYLTVLVQSDETLAGREAAYWLKLRSEGADSGAISIFASNASACNAELGAVGSVKAMTSFVARFEDEGEADRAWLSGVFGFQPPPVGQIVPGVTRGTSTGLGPSSFIYERPSVRLASWHRSLFVALVVVSNMDAATFKAATAAIDPRLN